MAPRKQMKEILGTLALISLFLYICLLPWLAMYRILMVLARVTRWIAIKIIDFSSWVFRGALYAHGKHRAKNPRVKKNKEEEQFGDSLEF